ncbi:hypothetical protein MM300_07755 [Evansella sp. LMS18]|jgi:hypothetical protein|uniref:hypothetical protein n=1 Tax=Evansella sp. LMS18 TaxID=2924033 RepID=UPI0020D17C2E|nr:hypothetical protein [Evansella sp. LMS18]UTR12174.1 hypothetical protein MM300_07755 [Evansella sp. LMS18]
MYIGKTAGFFHYYVNNQTKGPAFHTIFQRRWRDEKLVPSFGKNSGIFQRRWLFLLEGSLKPT